MSGQGTARNTRKIDYVPPYRFKKIWWRAGPELRRQALERAVQETLFPHSVWGIEGLTSEFRTSGNNGAVMTERVLSKEAKERLSLLRAVNI